MIEKRPSGLGRRIAAMLYDSLLVLALLVLVTVPFYFAGGGGEVDIYDDNPFHQAMWIVIPFIFFVGFWSTKGRTLGMQSWGLQLEDAEGRVPGPGRASIRFAAAILSAACLGLGFLWQLVDRDKLAWHDRLSGTRLMHYPRRKPEKADTASVDTP